MVEVKIFEDHASVLPEWYRRGIKGRTLIYLDAHLDLQLIRDDRLRDLCRCTMADEVLRLQKPHHLYPDRSYSYSIEDFLYPAHRLGIVDRVVWVVPPRVQVDFSMHVFEHLQQMDGVTFKELSGFRKDASGWYEGHLVGMDITICRYEHLAKLPLADDSLIDIDTDYFVDIPEDRPWIDPFDLYRAISDLSFTPEFVTITRSVESGFMPLCYRYFSDYLAALWQNHPEDVGHYRHLYQADQWLLGGDRHESIACARQALLKRPGCAATYYLLSRLETDPQLAQDYHHQAAGRCEKYHTNLLRSICGVLCRQLTVNAETVQQIESQLETHEDQSVADALCWIAIGLIYCELRCVDKAIQCYGLGARLIGRHPELALGIGTLILQTSNRNQADEWLHIALGDDKTATAAHILLSESCVEQGKLDLALQHLQAAHELAPAWSMLLTMMADLHDRLGNPAEAEVLRAQAINQISKLRQLVEQSRQ